MTNIPFWVPYVHMGALGVGFVLFLGLGFTSGWRVAFVASLMVLCVRLADGLARRYYRGGDRGTRARAR